MKRVRLTVTPVDASLPPTGDLLSRAEYVDRALGLQWNVTGDPVTLMAEVEGDVDRLEAELSDHPGVRDFELVPVEPGHCYVFARDERTEAAEALFGPYLDSELLVVPPVEYDGEGLHATVVGDPASVQRIVDGAGDGVEVSVEYVGGFTGARESILAGLSERQREAVEAGHEVGYYDVPRSVTHEAVADALGVAPSTASEHLRKAEARIVRGVLEGVE